MKCTRCECLECQLDRIQVDYGVVVPVMTEEPDFINVTYTYERKSL